MEVLYWKGSWYSSLAAWVPLYTYLCLENLIVLLCKFCLKKEWMNEWMNECLVFIFNKWRWLDHLECLFVPPALGLKALRISSSGCECLLLWALSVSSSGTVSSSSPMGFYPLFLSLSVGANLLTRKLVLQYLRRYAVFRCLACTHIVWWVWVKGLHM